MNPYYISKFILPIDIHPRFSTAKKNYETLSRVLRVHLVKKTPSSHQKHQNCMPNSLHT